MQNVYKHLIVSDFFAGAEKWRIERRSVSVPELHFEPNIPQVMKFSLPDMYFNYSNISTNFFLSCLVAGGVSVMCFQRAMKKAKEQIFISTVVNNQRFHSCDLKTQGRRSERFFSTPLCLFDISLESK